MSLNFGKKFYLISPDEYAKHQKGNNPYIPSSFSPSAPSSALLESQKIKEKIKQNLSGDEDLNTQLMRHSQLMNEYLKKVKEIQEPQQLFMEFLRKNTSLPHDNNNSFISKKERKEEDNEEAKEEVKNEKEEKKTYTPSELRLKSQLEKVGYVFTREGAISGKGIKADKPETDFILRDLAAPMRSKYVSNDKNQTKRIAATLKREGIPIARNRGLKKPKTVIPTLTRWVN